MRDGWSRHERARSRSPRSEEHTSELQSLAYLVCRLLLEKKKKNDVAVVEPQDRVVAIEPHNKTLDQVCQVLTVVIDLLHTAVDEHTHHADLMTELSRHVERG